MSDHKQQRKHLQEILEKIDQNSKHKFMDSLEVKYSKEKKHFEYSMKNKVFTLPIEYLLSR